MNRECSYKKFTILYMALFLVLTIVGMAFVWVVDPFFHYHHPYVVKDYELRGTESRYINSGLARNFEYNAIITGSSMTWNFKTAEMNELFDVHSIKFPFPMGFLCEVGDNLRIGLASSNEVSIVVQSLDTARLLYSRSDFIKEDGNPKMYPYYIQDDKLINDLKYLANKEVIIRSCEALYFDMNNNCSTQLDEYSLFGVGLQSGVKAVYDSLENHTYSLPALNNAEHISDSDVEILKNNLMDNVVDIARRYPNTDFYIFIPPYSIGWWENFVYKNNYIDYHFEMFDIVAETLLQEENIYLFCFFDDFDMICNFNNYLNYSHYTDDINSYILKCMKNGEHKLTKDNYKEYFANCYDFYRNYDYEHLYDALQ